VGLDVARILRVERGLVVTDKWKGDVMDGPASGPIQAVVAVGQFKETIHGRTPVDRHVQHLNALGLRVFVHDPNRAPARLPAMTDAVLWVDGDTILDPRLYALAWAAVVGSRLDDGVPIGLCKVTAAAATTRVQRGSTESTEAMLDVAIESVDAYLPALRRHLRPYWVRLEDASSRRRAERHVLDAAQKGSLDFPARFLHPLPENYLATRLVGTGLTPNHVTLISALIGFMATYFFANACYLTGFVCALAANVLDGVDGKLARITLRQSEGGDRLDHVLDIGFEFSWYVALGWSLSQDETGNHPLQVGFTILVAMVACRLVSGSYQMMSDRSIHDHRAFDRMFRVVAGRRNNYILLLLVGYMVGALNLAFQVVLAYAVLTLFVYLVRNVMVLPVWRSRSE